MQKIIKSKHNSKTIISLFLVLISLILFGAACSFSGQSNLKGTQIALDIQSTRQVLKQTELAEGGSNQQDQNNPPQSPTITPSQTLRPTNTADTLINIDTPTPTPTQTAVVIQPATITPTSTAQAVPGLEFFDDFSDSTSGWPIQETGPNLAGYNNNHYQIKVGDPNLRYVNLYSYEMTNGYIQTIAIVTQDKPQASYGVVWRWQDNDNFYYAEIASNGTYLIGRWLNGVHSYIRQGTHNSAIKLTGYNSIDVNFISDELSLFVNDYKIDTVYDNALSKGYIGLSATTGEYGGFEVSFDLIGANP